MKLLIIGSTGMLGQSLMKEAQRRKLRVVGISRHDKDYPLDITNDVLLEQALCETRPDVIINAAAIIKLDICDLHPSLAYLTNARAVNVMANIAKKLNAFFVQISTDHYYTGDKDRKHSESDPITLVNEYARTKYAGECFALTHKNSMVVRTNVIGFRNNDDNPTFVEWVIRSLKNAVPMTLFSDNYTSGIDVRQFTPILFDCIEKERTGVLNISSRDVFSKKELIESIATKLSLSLRHAKSGKMRGVIRSTRAESVGLDVSNAESLVGYHLPSFDDVVSSIAREYTERFL